MAGKAITKYAVLAILSVGCLTALAQSAPPTPVLSELKRTEPPHVELRIKITGNPESVENFKVVRKILIDGSSDGRIITDKEVIVPTWKMKRSYVAAKSEATFIYTDKLHPHSTQVYLYYVIALANEQESAESNKIELHP